MRSQLLIVFGISSTLLGIYIMIISLLNMEERADYHIGCYLSNTTNDNSFTFKSRLQQLRSRGNNNRNFHSRVRSLDLIDTQLHLKSVDLTKNVDSYIQKLTLTKKYQEGNMEFFIQLSNARKSYGNCVGQLKANFSIDNSKSLWNEYSTCFEHYRQLKQNISKLYSKRHQYLQQIDTLLVYDSSINPNFDFEAQLKIIKQRYQRQNTENDKNKINFIGQLKRLQIKNQTKTSEHDQNQRQYNRAQLQYDICLKNLKQFRKCQDIAKALREYGYVEPVQSLEDRIKSKRQMLIKMRQLVLKSRQDGGNNEAITQMYAKREKQLIQTIKLRLYMGYDEMKECGCTEEHRKKLEGDYQNAKMKLNLNKKEINDLISQIFTLERKIKQTDKLRQRLINEFTDQTERLKNRQTSNILTLKERLQILRTNLTNVNGQINQYDNKLNSLEFQCNQYKDRLSLILNDSQKVTDCFSSKDFYDQLKSKAQLILKNNDESSLMSRQKVKISLKDIIYPDNSYLKQTLQVDRAIADLQTIQQVSKQVFPEQRIVKDQVIVIQKQIDIKTSTEEMIIQHEQVVIIQTTLSQQQSSEL